MNLVINIHSAAFNICGPEEILEYIKKDFSYFLTARAGAQSPLLLIQLKTDAPEKYMSLSGKVKKHRWFSKFNMYNIGSVCYIDYNGRGLAVWRRSEDRLEIISADIDLLHEICYLAVISFAGEKLEKKNFWRMHGMGLSARGKGVMFFAPMAGGKTSLFLELMKNPGFSFFSDDVILTDKKLMMHPFPLRLGLRKGEEEKLRAWNISDAYELKRRQYGTKVLADIAHFGDRISSPVKVETLVIGRKAGNARLPLIRKAGRAEALAVLTKNFVVGVGLPQLVEYLNISFGAAGILSILTRVARRVAHAIKIVFSCRIYKFRMGRDIAENARMLDEFLLRLS
ncbi:MAG: hypothetical protein JXJ19_06530 [Elusimicrobia bacterium]|nr:hypothetical protein [Elusimicrobiota bacterium]